jgi:hypothetical protein
VEAALAEPRCFPLKKKNRTASPHPKTALIPCPPGMDLTAWFGPQGVFSTGDAAHIFGSGPVLPVTMRRHQAQPEGLGGISNGVFLSPWEI